MNNEKLVKLNNFYLIELRNEAISCIFKNAYNLNFFAVASDEFENDIEVINTSDQIINQITSSIGNHSQSSIEFNPTLFPHLVDEYKMKPNDEGEIDNVHPYTAKRTVVSLFNAPIITARAITTPTNLNDISVQ